MTALHIPLKNRPVYLQTDARRLLIMVRGEPFLIYSYGNDRSPSVSALYAADNRQVAGKPDGTEAITIGHGDVNGLSFIEGGRGAITTQELVVRRGLFSAGFVHHLFWRDHNDVPILAESRRIRVMAGPCEGGILDITLRLTPLLESGVRFAASAHDILQIHLAAGLCGELMGAMRDEHGRCGHHEVNGRISRWVSVDGVIRGETVGLVVLDHPLNPFYPTTWHADRFGTLSPSPILWAGVEETLTRTIVLRYRLHTHFGYVEAGWSHARFLDFAAEPTNNNFGEQV